MYNIPKISIPKVNIPPVTTTPVKVTIPDIPNCKVRTAKTTSVFGEMSKGERAGYSDGFNGRANLSVGKDTNNNDYWIGYSCGYVSGSFDRQNGNNSTL